MNTTNSSASELTSRMVEILTLMMYADELAVTNVTQATAEVLGENLSAIAAVQRHLTRRGFLDRDDSGKGYALTEKARAWWETRPESRPPAPRPAARLASAADDDEYSEEEEE